MRREDPRPRVLIVDDEESTRLLLARLLHSELQIESQLAGTCEQALHLARSSVYDAILLDLMMPGIGGLPVLQLIRGGSLNTTTPVIVVSIVADPAMIAQCMSAGASAYHVKPVRRVELVATVKAQFAARAKTRI